MKTPCKDNFYKKAKRKYTSPQLKKHGSVAKLTLKGGSVMDFSNSYNP